MLQLLDARHLWKLTRDPDIGIALAGYLELHGDLVPRAESPPKHLERLYGPLLELVDRQSLPRQVRDPLDAQRFFGFLEGRTGLQPPGWWEKAYLEQYTHRIFQYHQSPLGASLRHGILEVPIGLSVTEHNGRIAVRQGDSSLSVSRAVLDKVDNAISVQQCTAVINGDIGVLALFAVPGNCSLLCVKKDTVQWTAKAWNYGAPNRIGVTGPWIHDLELTIQGDQVAVFGAGTGGAYVEVFDKKTEQIYSASPRPIGFRSDRGIEQGGLLGP